MSESEKQTALTPLQHTALTKVGAKSLVARGRAELRAREEAEEWFKKGLEFCQKKLGASMNPHPIGSFARLAFARARRGRAAAQIPSYAEATFWWRKAAEQGIADAQWWLGIAYYYGKGVPQDHVMADFWYRKAAEQKEKYALRKFGDAVCDEFARLNWPE
jgi:TPR repeat protein